MLHFFEAVGLLTGVLIAVVEHKMQLIPWNKFRHAVTYFWALPVPGLKCFHVHVIICYEGLVLAEGEVLEEGSKILFQGGSRPAYGGIVIG